MNVFEAVRENGITARQAAEHCGIKINRSGMAVCPFHNDKNPSMKIDRRYYCFGCGEKGDAIVFHRGTSYQLRENPAEIIPAAEAEAVGKLLDGEVSAAQKNMGPVYLDPIHIIVDTDPGFLRAFVGEVIFRVACQGSQVSGPDFIFRMHFNIVPALSDRRREPGILTDFMYPVDEIVIHQQGDSVDFIIGTGIFRRLDIGISQRISCFRR